MSMQEPANHYRLGLKLGTYCDNASGPKIRVEIDAAELGHFCQ